LDRVVARGGVVIRQKARTAWGDVAEFLQKERKIQLSGNTRLEEGDSQVEGAKLTVFLDEGTSLLESKPGRRVSAVLFEEDFGPGLESDKEAVESMLPEIQP
jgi:lipopolysaccharide export system protein LptA